MSLTKKIESLILSKMVSEKERKVGIEVEGLYYDKRLNRLPVNPTNQYSAIDLFNDIKKLTSLDSPYSYSLEPGGQIEWASGPAISLWNIHSQFNSHVEIEDKVCQANEIKRLYLSLEPLLKPNDIDLIKMKKYQLMDKVFQTTGDMGAWMMRNTTSIQINIDYTSEVDANHMGFIADAIQPFFSILFSNAPFIKGEKVKQKNMRWRIWENTDPSRCQSLINHKIYNPNSIVRDYAKWIQQVPAIFSSNDLNTNHYNGTLGEMVLSFSDSLKNNILSALHQSFTNVRYKTVLEIRSGDRPLKGQELAPVAFIVGLLTAKNTRQSLFEIIKNWSKKDRIALIDLANDISFEKIGPEGKSVGEWLEILSDLALQGLDERCSFLNIKNERKLLESTLSQFLNAGPNTLSIQKRFARSGLSLNSFLLDLT